MSRVPKHLVIDDFLPQDLLDRMLSYALALEPELEQTGIGRLGEHDETLRRSSRDPQELGPLRKAFRAEILRHHREWFVLLGMKPFEPSWAEVELVIHRDGDFYTPHVDTGTAAHRHDDNSDRVLTSVYYFNREPKGYSGGQLGLFGFGDTEPALLIEPANNRLVAFPSIAMHEVMPVACPGNNFANARFAVNCWLHRQRSEVA